MKYIERCHQQLPLQLRKFLTFQMKTRLHILNSTVNIFWTAVCCTPVVLFWTDNYNPLPFFLLLSISCVFLFSPASLFKAVQLSQRRKFYEQLGVRHVQVFTQNGELINRSVKRKNASYKVVKGKADLPRLHRQMMAYEKYHLVCFVFFMSSIIFGILHSEYRFAALIFVANLVYNVYPLLIQQYNRLRMGKGVAILTK